MNSCTFFFLWTLTSRLITPSEGVICNGSSWYALERFFTLAWPRWLYCSTRERFLFFFFRWCCSRLLLHMWNKKWPYSAFTGWLIFGNFSLSHPFTAWEYCWHTKASKEGSKKVIKLPKTLSLISACPQRCLMSCTKPKHPWGLKNWFFFC